jgi:chromosome segregation ATPase
MGWVSMSEDIEEIRAQREHFKKGLNNIRKMAATSKFSELKRAERDLTGISRRINTFLDELQEKTLRIFDQAEARIKAPNVRIVSRLDKKEKELIDIRGRLQRVQADLSTSRQTTQELQRKLNSATKELVALRAENSRLKDNSLWVEEVKTVRKLD